MRIPFFRYGSFHFSTNSLLDKAFPLNHFKSGAMQSRKFLFKLSMRHLFDKCTSKKLPEGQVLTDPMLTIFSTPSSITLTMYSREAFNFIIFAFPDVTFTKLLYSFVNGEWIVNAEKSNVLTPRFFSNWWHSKWCEFYLTSISSLWNQIWPVFILGSC